MKNYDDKFEEFLSTELKKAAEQITPPDIEEGWKDIEKRLNTSKRKQRSRLLLKKIATVAAVIIIFLTGVMVGTSNYANANFNFLKNIKKIFGNTTSISISTSQNTHAEIEQETNIVKEKKMYTLKEANNLLDYSIVLPEYIPSDYILTGVSLRNEENNMSAIKIHYQYSDSEILIGENPITKQTAISHNVRNAETKTLNINGSEATLIYFKDLNMRELIFQQSIMYYEISGPLSEGEIIKIAKSIPQI